MSSSDAKLFDAARLDAALDSTDPLQALPQFRETLRRARAQLEQQWRDGLTSDKLLHQHAQLIDALLIRAWRLHAGLLAKKTSIALVAVGGYGRGELYPHSDIDLLLLLKNEKPEQVKAFAEPFLRFLWDLGLEVGHSVRTLKDCVVESKKDITVATNLMEARLILGDAELFAAMQERTGPKKLWPSGKFFAAKLAEQHARHRRYDDTAYNLEPNIKEGPGGLRDIQMIAWVTQRHFGSTSLHELVTQEFLTEREYRALERGRRLLTRIRCGLHYLAGRREDRLLFDHQRALAAELGFRDKRGSRAVELFMKQYYRTVKELALLNEILLQHLEETLLTRGTPKVKPVNRRFQARGAYLETTRANTFERFPLALLELFLILQQRPELKGVRAATIRLLRENLHRINTKFRNDIASRSLFMEILRQPHGITHELRRMNAYGVLGAYLPAFGRIVGQMQHDLFHVYTVDQHTLFVVRNLRRFTVPEFREEFPFASELIQQVVKPERLVLAGLFHDIAKGRGGDHSELGEDEVVQFCRRHGLSDYDTRFVAWLVRHHLLMSHVAQRQDIHDPDVVLEFARKVGDVERLDHLYLLTVADMRGTSPKVWNVWKDRLLIALHAETLKVLRRGLAEPMDVEARITDLETDALALLKKQNIAPEQAQELWSKLDAGYFLHHDAGAIAWHTAVIAGSSASDLPLVAARYRPQAGGTEFLVYTPDRPGLFADITGGFDQLNLTIMDARIHTTRFGFALDTYVVLDHDLQPVSDTRTLQSLAHDMRALLLAPKPGRDFGKSMLPRTLKHFPIPTRVSFGSSAQGTQTVMEVRTQDRPGLLYQVAQALGECQARLLTAKVATYGERAEDYFFLTDAHGQPLADSQRQCLEQQIQDRLKVDQDTATPR
jgi:[protein-PII] uridylyltransferase